MATIPSPHTWTAGEIATAGNMNTLTQAINFLLNPPIFRGYQATATNLATGTWSTLPIDTELYDTDNLHSTTTNPTRLTVQTAGLYLLSATVGFAANATGVRYVEIGVNGTYIASGQTGGAATSAQTTSVLVTRVLDLNVGDYVEISGYQTSGAALATNVQDVSIAWQGMHV